MAQLKDHLAALSKPAEDEEEGETRLEREFNVCVWLHVHTCIHAYSMCVCGPVFMSCMYVHNICAIASGDFKGGPGGACVPPVSLSLSSNLAQLRHMQHSSN